MDFIHVIKARSVVDIVLQRNKYLYHTESE